MNLRFDISRLQLPEGIFRLQGQWQPDQEDSIIFDHIYLLSTDGWVELAGDAAVVGQLLPLLRSEVRQHLSS